jgi:hypothetical protein
MDRRLTSGKRPQRRINPQLDQLEDLQLLSTGTGVHHSLGPFFAPSLIRPRVSSPAQLVDPHILINTYMTSILGSEVQPIEQAVENQQTSTRSNLVEGVLGNPFVHSILGVKDSFTLLNSPGMSALIGFSPSQSGQTSSSGVIYVVPVSSILAVNGATSTVSIPPSNNFAGFIVEVPTSNLRLLSDGTVSVLVPQDQIPVNAPPPTSTAQLTGALADVFSVMGPLIASALQTSLPLKAPNAPASVPGLRLARLVAHTRSYPLASTPFLLRMLRVAVDRGLYNLGATQMIQVQSALQQFETQASSLNQQGVFNPAIPPAPPPLPPARLGGTLQVSIGALQDLINVAPGATGLQLPGVGNFPGRIDAGYIIARNGDYGLALTLRGPLYPAATQPGVDNVGSTIQIEVSNASNLSQLNGLRNTEGLSIGTALMGTVTTSRSSTGISTYATSAGYGVGFEYGTAIAYTLIIPLGNMNAIIPQLPPSR